MEVTLHDPEWPAGPPPDLEAGGLLGEGVGGRRYRRLARPGPWGAALFAKDFGEGSRARRAARAEFRAARRLREAGGPCPRPWAVLEGRTAVLLSRDCGDEARLGREEVLRDEAILQGVARAAAALHAAGAVHGDLHLGNLLRDGEGQLLWTDLHRLSWPAASARDARLRDLGWLWASLDPYQARPLLRFAREYLAARPGSGLRAVELARAIDARALERLRRHFRNLDRRARRRIPHNHPQVWRAADRAREVERFETPADADTPLKRGSRSEVRRVETAPGRSVVVKHFPPRKLLDPRNRLGRSKALRGLLAAEALRRRGLPAVLPLAAWSRPGRGSWLLLEDFRTGIPLQEAILRVEGGARARLLTLLARLVRRMHRLGVAYRDLKASNVLVDLARPERPVLALIDHDRNRFRRGPVGAPTARRDLAALHAALPPAVRAAERWRALRAYDPIWTRRCRWEKDVRPLLAEAAQRRHLWIPRRLLGGPAAPNR